MKHVGINFFRIGHIQKERETFFLSFGYFVFCIFRENDADKSILSQKRAKEIKKSETLLIDTSTPIDMKSIFPSKM